MKKILNKLVWITLILFLIVGCSSSLTKTQIVERTLIEIFDVPYGCYPKSSEIKLDDPVVFVEKSSSCIYSKLSPYYEISEDQTLRSSIGMVMFDISKDASDYNYTLSIEDESLMIVENGTNMEYSMTVTRNKNGELKKFEITGSMQISKDGRINYSRIYSDLRFYIDLQAKY